MNDKAMHYVAGTIAGMACLPFGDIHCLLSALAAGIVRELYNMAKDGIFDPLDVAATVSGGFCVALAANIGVMR